MTTLFWVKKVCDDHAILVRHRFARFATDQHPRAPMGSRYTFIAVYIMTNRRHGTLYIGVTSDLIERVHQHREGLIEGFTKKHGLKRLVWYERHENMTDAIRRETSLKKYKRDWKINMIERENPGWDDLFPGILIHVAYR